MLSSSRGVGGGGYLSRPEFDGSGGGSVDNWMAAVLLLLQVNDIAVRAASLAALADALEIKRWALQAARCKGVPRALISAARGLGPNSRDCISLDSSFLKSAARAGLARSLTAICSMCAVGSSEPQEVDVRGGFWWALRSRSLARALPTCVFGGRALLSAARAVTRAVPHDAGRALRPTVAAALAASAMFAVRQRPRARGAAASAAALATFAHGPSIAFALGATSAPVRTLIDAAYAAETDDDGAGCAAAQDWAARAAALMLWSADPSTVSSFACDIALPGGALKSIGEDFLTAALVHGCSRLRNSREAAQGVGGATPAPLFLPARLVARVTATLSRAPNAHTLPLLIALARGAAGRAALSLSAAAAPLWLRCGGHSVIDARIAALISTFAASSLRDVALAASVLQGVEGAARHALATVTARVAATNPKEAWARVAARELSLTLSGVVEGFSFDGGAPIASVFAMLPLLRPSDPTIVRAIVAALDVRCTLKPSVLILAALGAAANQAAVRADGVILLRAFGALRAAARAAEYIVEQSQLREISTHDTPTISSHFDAACFALGALTVNSSATNIVPTSELDSIRLPRSSYAIDAARALNESYAGLGGAEGGILRKSPIPKTDASAFELSLFAWTMAAHGRIPDIPAARIATRMALESAHGATREGIALALCGPRSTRRPLIDGNAPMTFSTNSSDESDASDGSTDDKACRAQHGARQCGASAKASVHRFARSLSSLIASPRSPPAAAAAALTALLRARAAVTQNALAVALASQTHRVSRRAARAAARDPHSDIARPLAALLSTANAHAGAAAAGRALTILARFHGARKSAAIRAGAPQAALSAISTGAPSVARAAVRAIGALASPAACEEWTDGVATSVARLLAKTIGAPQRTRLPEAAARAIASMCDERTPSFSARTRALEVAAAFVGAGGARALVAANAAATATVAARRAEECDDAADVSSFTFAASSIARAGARSNASAITAALVDIGFVDISTTALAARATGPREDETTLRVTSTLLASFGARACTAPAVLSRVLDSAAHSTVCAGALALARDTLARDTPEDDATTDDVLRAALHSGVHVLMWSAALALSHCLMRADDCVVSGPAAGWLPAELRSDDASEGSTDSDESAGYCAHSAHPPRPRAIASIPSALLTCALDHDGREKTTVVIGGGESSSAWVAAAVSRAAAVIAAHSGGSRRALVECGGVGVISCAASALAPYSSARTLRPLSAALASLATASDTRKLWVEEASEASAKIFSSAGWAHSQSPLRASLALASAERACGVTRANAVRATAASATPGFLSSQEDASLALRSIVFSQELPCLLARAAPTQAIEASAAALATAAAAAAIGGAWVPLRREGRGASGDGVALDLHGSLLSLAREPPRALADALSKLASASRSVMSAASAPARAANAIGGGQYVGSAAGGGGAAASTLSRGAPSRAAATAFSLAAATLDAAADALHIPPESRASWVNGAIWCAIPLAAARDAPARARLSSAFAASALLGGSPPLPPAAAHAALTAILAGAHEGGGSTQVRLLRCAAFGLAGTAFAQSGTISNPLSRRALLAALRSGDLEAGEAAAFACLAVASAAAAADSPRGVCVELCDGSDDARSLLRELAALATRVPPCRVAAGALLILARAPRNLPELAAARVTGAIQVLARAATGVARKSCSSGPESRADGDARRALGEFAATTTARFNAAQAVFALATQAAAKQI